MDLRAYFNSVDLDRTGHITALELAQTLGKVSVTVLWVKMARCVRTANQHACFWEMADWDAVNTPFPQRNAL
jgi:hypothetical protein